MLQLRCNIFLNPIHLAGVKMKSMCSTQSRAWNVDYGYADLKLTKEGGVSFAARLAKESGLCELLETQMNGTLKVRRRGASEAQSILAQVYSLSMSKGHLSDLDDSRHNSVYRLLTGLGEMPCSRRMGEFLRRFRPSDLSRLRQVVAQWLGPLTAEVARRNRDSEGFVPVFIDGTDIEVDGKCFEGAAYGYRNVRRYQMHSVFVGNLMVSARLNEGDRHATHGWLEQLDEDVLGLLSGESDVWIRADNAYYKGEFAEYCRAHGFDYSVSVTNPNCKDPVVDKVWDMADDQWEWINDEEQAIYAYYRPSRWKHKATYAVIRRVVENGQKVLHPSYVYAYAYTVILVSTDELPIAEAVARHRGKQGQENAFKGPLNDMNLHHPPCKSYMANQAFYLCGLLAQALVRGVQYWMMPPGEWRRSLGTIIERLIEIPAMLTRSARRFQLKFDDQRRNKYEKWLNAVMFNSGELDSILLE